MARRLSKSQRGELLKLLCNGHDVESACSVLKIGQKEIAAGGAKLVAEIGEAYKIGTARLRARIMESALSGDNAAVLMKLLEQREAAEATGEAGAQITEIRHVIIEPLCPHCGKRPVIRDDEGRAP
ncbi:MAG: hypothetical protein OES46_21970 [Gammaproteobacteria bacterium]|nr:hypothetical protein [Gammaproteobacteria bacterium]